MAFRSQRPARIRQTCRPRGCAVSPGPVAARGEPLGRSTGHARRGARTIRDGERQAGDEVRQPLPVRGARVTELTDERPNSGRRRSVISDPHPQYHWASLVPSFLVAGDHRRPRRPGQARPGRWLDAATRHWRSGTTSSTWPCASLRSRARRAAGRMQLAGSRPTLHRVGSLTTSNRRSSALGTGSP